MFVELYVKIMATLIIIGVSGTVATLFTDAITDFRHHLMERVVPKTAGIAGVGFVMGMFALLSKVWLSV